MINLSFFSRDDGTSVKGILKKELYARLKEVVRGEFGPGCEWQPWERCVDVPVTTCFYVKRCQDDADGKKEKKDGGGEEGGCEPICEEVCTPTETKCQEMEEESCRDICLD